MSPRGRPAVRFGPLAALAGVATVTALWWALALWPATAGTPAWVARARLTCFGAEASGLPDASGWMMLVIQPGVMLGTLVAIWGRELGESARALGRSTAGRAALAGVAGIALIAAGLVAHRVREASASVDSLPVTSLETRLPRLDVPAPALSLVDQRGRAFELADLGGRPAFLTFAFGHCETVCPRLVAEALAARRALPDLDLAVLVVTLDPWRDTPARLPRLARAWGVGPEGRVLGGSVAEVNRVLDAWDVPRTRDPDTGEVIHAPLTYVIDERGRIAYRTRGDRPTLERLASR